MDRGLDEIIADTRSNRPRNNRGQGRRREPRNDFPRDGVRKVDFPRSPMMPTRPVQPSSQLILSMLGALVD
jgi:hypothetical protein